MDPRDGGGNRGQDRRSRRGVPGDLPGRLAARLGQNIEFLARRGSEICAGSAADPAAFVEQYRSVLWMTPAEIIMDVLRKG